MTMENPENVFFSKPWVSGNRWIILSGSADELRRPMLFYSLPVLTTSHMHSSVKSI